MSDRIRPAADEAFFFEVSMHRIVGGALVAACLVSASAATAATLTYAESLPGPFVSSSVPGSPDVFPGPLFQTISLQKFDASLGVLTGVDIHAGITGTATGGFYNCVARGTDCDNEAITLTLKIAGYFGIPVYTLTAVRDLTCTAAEGVVCSDPRTINMAGSITPPIGPGAFASYTGAGAFDVSLHYLPSWTPEARISTVAASNLFASVTYTYDETPASVPLPAGLPLLLCALGILGVIARSRRGSA